MTTFDVDNPVSIEPEPLRGARYLISAYGEFVERGEAHAPDREPAVIELLGEPGVLTPVLYSSDTARAAAAQLLGYVHHRGHGEPLPDHLPTTLLAPDERTATISTWDLGHGRIVRYVAPFGAEFITEPGEWPLTADLATQWARALLTVAAELDHAYAVAAQAVLAQRTGTTATRKIRDWVGNIAAELTDEQRTFVERLRSVLADEESIARGDTLFAAIDLAHPQLWMALTELRLLSRETITHLDAAKVIREVASLFAIPVYLWTAETDYVTRELGGIRLSEQEWQRVHHTGQFCIDGIFEDWQDNNRVIDVVQALQQAGVLCRVCGVRIEGEIDETLGLCGTHRSPDPTTALAQAVEAECAGDYSMHSPGNDGRCTRCGIPLPADYQDQVNAREAESEKRRAEHQAEHQAAEARQTRIVNCARQLMDQDLQTVTLTREPGTLDDPRDDMPRKRWSVLVDVRKHAAGLFTAALTTIAARYVDKATQIIDTDKTATS